MTFKISKNNKDDRLNKVQSKPDELGLDSPNSVKGEVLQTMFVFS